MMWMSPLIKTIQCFNVIFINVYVLHYKDFLLMEDMQIKSILDDGVKRPPPSNDKPYLQFKSVTASWTKVICSLMKWIPISSSFYKSEW